MQKLYAKLCQEVKERNYVGEDTEFAKTVVDNEIAKIYVDFDAVKFVNSVHIEGNKIVLNQITVEVED